MAMEYFCCYHSYLNKLSRLSDQEVGRLFRALMEYSASGEAPELAGRESLAFDFIADDIDRQKDNYAARCETNKRNRASTVVNDGQRSSTIVDERHQNKNKNENEDENNTTKVVEKRTRFTPPTVEEVREYCRERHNNVDPQKFVDYYSSNGWKVGRNVMKDWQAAVRSWERNEFNKAPDTGPASYDIERAETRAKTKVPELKKRRNAG